MIINYINLLNNDEGNSDGIFEINNINKKEYSEKLNNELITIYGELIFTNWLKFLLLNKMENNTVFLAVKNRFVRDWIVKNYLEGINKSVVNIFQGARFFAISLANEFASEVFFNVNKQSEFHNIEEKNIKNIDANKSKQDIKVKKNRSIRKKDVTTVKIKSTNVIKSKKDLLGEKVDQKPKKRSRIVKKKNEYVVISQGKTNEKTNVFKSNLNSNFTFETFVVGDSNKFAFNAMQKVANNIDSDPLSNPLFLRGDVGLGKTHLMHAAAHCSSVLHSRRKIVYLTAEKFMYEFISALKNKNIMDFKEKFRSVDILMIDDIQFMCGKESTQEEFFHTFNSLMEGKKQLIFAADRHPNELTRIEERIRSRLSGGLVVDINTTTFELRLNILKKKISNLSIEFPSEVLDFLAEYITSNVRELEGALNRLIAHHQYTNNPICILDAKDLLRDMLGKSLVVVNIKAIQKKVADYYNISIVELNSKSKIRKIVRPRQVAMFMAKNLTTKSLVEIGKMFGGRDHSTVMHAIKNIQKLKKKDMNIDSDIRNINDILQN